MTVRQFLFAVPLLVSSLSLPASAWIPIQAPTVKPANRARLVENAGQFPEEVQFAGHSNGLDVFVTRDGFVTRFAREIAPEGMSPAERAFVPRGSGASRWVGASVRATLVGANPGAVVRGENLRQGAFHYLKGNDPSKWVRGARLYDSFVVDGWLPGISARFRDAAGTLTYDWILTPGASPGAIVVEFEGADSVKIDNDGSLVLATAFGEVRHTAPRAFEGTKDGRSVVSRFRLLGDRRVGFEVEGRDATKALVIDPGIEYATLVGGTGTDQVNDVATDTAGNCYFTGYTFAVNYPVTLGSFDFLKNGDADAFVTKLASDGSDFVYSTFVGGDSADQGMSIAVDGLGQAHVVGGTLSPTFPTTQFAYDKAYSTGSQTGDGFVVKLSADGSNLVLGTYLGGNNDDIALRIALDINNDANKNIVVTGWTRSVDFINQVSSPSAFDNTFNGYTTELGDAFVAKLDKTGSSLMYATVLGGPEGDAGGGIAVDAFGIIYVTGVARTAFPVKGTFAQVNKGKGDAFIAAINPLQPGAASLVFSNLFGGIGFDYGYRLALDISPAVFITGYTESLDFPKVAASFDTIYNNLGDAFVLKMNTAGTQLGYSTYLGGVSSDSASSLAVDAAGSAYVAGRTRSSNFPVTAGVFDKTPNGKFDGFVAKLAPAGNKILTGAYVGGINDDEILGLALVATNLVWVGGTTFSSNFPFTPDAKDSSIFQQDGFVAKVDMGPTPVLCLNDVKPIFVNYIVGDLNLPFVVRTVTNCGSPESTLNYHVSEVPFVPWMTPSVSAGAIQEGSGGTPISIDFDPAGLPEGAVNAMLQFENDEKDANLFDIPVVLTVQQDLSSPFVPGDGLTGFIDFQGEFDKATFSGIKGMKLKLGVTTTSGDVILGLQLVDATPKVVKTTFVNFSSKEQKRTLVIPADGEFTLVLRGNANKTGTLTSGGYSITSTALLPADAKVYSKKKQGPPAGVNKPLDRKRRLLAGATLDVTVEPSTTITGPLAISLLDPSNVAVDVVPFTQPFGVNGLQLVQVPITTAGLYTVRVTGLASPKEKVTLTITPNQPVGTGAVLLQ